MIDKFKLKFGRPKPGYHFKPGECVVNHNWAEEFRRGKSSQRQFDEMKMVVMEAGIGRETGAESYRLLYDSPSAAGSKLPGQSMDQWFVKIFVESNFETCDYPVI
jgi:hypothetical protein